MLLELTPVAVTVNSQDWYAYSSGILSCGYHSKIDHAVELMGYTSTYWIIKNSWGTSWGQHGYIWITRSRSGNCLLASGVMSYYGDPYFLLLHFPVLCSCLHVGAFVHLVMYLTYGFFACIKRFGYKLLMNQDLIVQHIEQLAQKQHIEGINRLAPNQYQVIYSPQLTNSPYSHLTFTLTINIPEYYPQQPPTVAFNEKIHHLNVDPLTGQVTMPILNDDWSPFLTLAAIFDSLDSLLQQPDKEYAATAQLRNEYLNKPKVYQQKVEQTIKEVNQLVLLNNSKEVVEHVDVIEDSKTNQKVLSNSFSEPQDQTLFQNSQDLSDIPKIKAKGPRGLVKKSEQIKIETLSNRSSEPAPVPLSYSPPKEIKNDQKQELESLQKSLAKQVKAREVQPSVLGKIPGEQPRRVFKRNDNIQRSRNSEFDKVHQSLIASDRMIQVLMEEHASMQQTLKRVGIGKLKEKLEAKQQRILQMLEQTLELSSSLREKLFAQLKADTKPLLG